MQFIRQEQFLEKNQFYDLKLIIGLRSFRFGLVNSQHLYPFLTILRQSHSWTSYIELYET